MVAQHLHFSIFLFIISTVCRQANGYNLDLQLVNVVDPDYSPSCTQDSVKTSIRSLDFKCKNALKPQWMNMLSWVSKCIDNCDEMIRINFNKNYKIVEFCLSQTYHNIHHKANGVDIQFGSNSNYYLKLDKNIFTECFLIRDESVKSINYMKVYPKKSTLSRVGLSSIMAFAYDSVKGTSTANKMYTNIASTLSGATCNASMVHFQGDHLCHKALDYTGGFTLPNQQWVVTCTQPHCVGQFMRVDFEIFAFSLYFSREDDSGKFLSQLKIDWSSGSIQILDIPINNHPRCFDYTEDFVENWVKATINKLPSNVEKNVGLGLFQVFADVLPRKEYTIKDTTAVFYHLPSTLTSVSFKAFIFGLYGINTTGNTCGQFQLKLYSSNNDAIFELLLSNSEKTFIKFNSKTYYTNEIIEFIKCNEWRYFWITMNDGMLQFGNGIVYGVSTSKSYVTAL
ncbi:DgyrCDS14457 [Dimorphilus gyrociliatus]|uniref:DgyrCDS14457 n=1 Tax=Dimorphilus gyrociliatus TaxID=2664684 RepID=A0A7I8WE20_9ANNE|nr:DgyrCDS14457 [Dimorphilus gyrociliatus]